MALTHQQQRFVEEYLVDLNATRAAIRAGYSERSAYQLGHKLKADPEVAEAIEEAFERQQVRTRVTADDVIRELAAIAFFDPAQAYGDNHEVIPVSKMDAKTRGAISGIETTEITEDGAVVGYVRKLKVGDKVKALELLGKHVGLWREKPTVPTRIILEHPYAEPEAAPEDAEE